MYFDMTLGYKDFCICQNSEDIMLKIYTFQSLYILFKRKKNSIQILNWINIINVLLKCFEVKCTDVCS